MSLLVELGQAVKARRCDMGLTVSALARLSKLSRATVSSLENGSCKDLSLTRTQTLLEVVGLALAIPTVHAVLKKPSLDPLARRPALEVAAHLATASLFQYATARDLQPAFLTDVIPEAFLPHVRHVLEEAPVSLLARIADQLHSERKVRRSAVWQHMRTHAQTLQVKRAIFAPEAASSAGRPA